MVNLLMDEPELRTISTMNYFEQLEKVRLELLTLQKMSEGIIPSSLNRHLDDATLSLARLNYLLSERD